MPPEVTDRQWSMDISENRQDEKGITLGAQAGRPAKRITFPAADRQALPGSNTNCLAACVVRGRAAGASPV